MNGDFAAFVQVILVDLILAGDNAVVIGALAAGLPDHQRRAAVFVGMLGAVVARILLSLTATWLLLLPGVFVIGGLLLFWIAWKMWRSMGEDADDGPSVFVGGFGSAVGAIVVADISMSLDNVVGVAGAAAGHLSALVFGLLLSVLLMGVAASWIAGQIRRHPWINYVGMALIVLVAVRMVLKGVGL